MDLREYMKISDEICESLYRANVGNCNREKDTLKTKLHTDLTNFAIYLMSADDTYDEDEIAIVREYLDKTVDEKLLKDMEQRRQVSRQFCQEIPGVLKFAVLSDAGKKLSPDPYKGQCAMIIYDCFKLMGQNVLALGEHEAKDATVYRYTLYTDRMEKFIREFGVWKSGNEKLYRPTEPEKKTKESAEEKAQKLDELLENLNALTGLESVKHQVNSLVNLIRVQEMRAEQGLKTTDVSKHMVFMGNPGTGKTTVARMLAEIYKYLGVLRTGQLIETDRSGLVRGYIGQTATRVQEVVDQALGGILFIDEAYALTVGKGEGDFGQEAVDTLLKAMEDHRDDMIVIVAGYTDLMDQFLESNPGLRSRFSNFIRFEDYTAEELMKIFENNLKKQEYKLSESAHAKAVEMVQNRVENKPSNFANARDIRNFMEHAISNQATRLIKEPNAKGNKEMLSTIEPEDLQDFE